MFTPKGNCDGQSLNTNCSKSLSIPVSFEYKQLFLQFHFSYSVDLLCKHDFENALLPYHIPHSIQTPQLLTILYLKFEQVLYNLLSNVVSRISLMSGKQCRPCISSGSTLFAQACLAYG